MSDTPEVVLYEGPVKYLDEIMADLPDNTMFNKVLTGSGGTTLALKNEVKYVICVPFKALIDNKAVWAKANGVDLLAVHGETNTTDEEIRNFGGRKIMVTYDSLPRVMENIIPKEWKILVDEAHKLVDSGAFRYRAIDRLLELFQEFGAYVFMTATPVPDKYQLPQLLSIPKSTIRWHGITPVNIKLTKVKDDITKYTTLLALRYLEGEYLGNAHIFINSVNSIVDILAYLDKLGKVFPEQVRIVCANNAGNTTKIRNKLGSLYTIGTTYSEARKVNFYTSTAFEGCDIMDKEAVSYVVVDGRKDSTKINIQTTLPQIVNRVRDSQNKNTITLLFTSSPYYSYTTAAEFGEVIKRELKAKRSVVEAYEKACADGCLALQNTLIKGIEEDEYLRFDKQDGKMRVNDTVWHSQMFAFETIHTTYFIKADAKMVDNTAVVNTIPYRRTFIDYQPLTGYDKLRLGLKPDFKALCLEYLSEVVTLLFGESPRGSEIGDAYPIIPLAYAKLGSEKMKALKYRRKAFEEAFLIDDAEKGSNHKVAALLDYRVGRLYSCKQVKSDLQRAYDKVGIQKKAKATDLSSFYEYRDQQQHKARGMVILAGRFQTGN